MEVLELKNTMWKESQDDLNSGMRLRGQPCTRKRPHWGADPSASTRSGWHTRPWASRLRCNTPASATDCPAIDPHSLYSFPGV